jgi:hypothetical protein
MALLRRSANGADTRGVRGLGNGNGVNDRAGGKSEGQDHNNKELIHGNVSHLRG